MTSGAPLPLHVYDSDLHLGKQKPTAKLTNFVQGRSIYIADVAAYDLHRSLLYALGAKSVANKMLAHVDLVLHGAAKAPAKAVTKYPGGEFVRAQTVLPLFHQEVDSFGAYIKALQTHGFTVRNPSDEGDAEFDFFTLPLRDGSLHATLLGYLGESEFVGKYAKAQHFPIDTREPVYIDFPVAKAGGVTWYYAWNADAWRRVSAQRGDGDYPLEIKGDQLMTVAPVLWKRSTGLYFFEYPHIDSITGLFIQAGVDARTGMVHGAAISRVWT